MSTCIGCGTPPVPAICTPGVTDTPVFFRPVGAHAPVPGFIRVTVLADCTQTVQHLDDALVAYGSLQPLVEVPYVSALGVTGGGGGGGHNTTIADGADVAQGATTAAAAPADGTGNYSLVAAAKRSLLNMAAMLTNWTTLLARVPTLGQKAATGSVPVILASDQSRVNVEPLGIPGTARQQATTTTSANVALTAGVGRISLFARGQPLRYVVGSSLQTANAATSHYLASGERIDIDVPATPNIAVIRASDATADGAAEITELS